MNAYDRIYLEKARITMGSMLEFAVHNLRMKLEEYYGLFLQTGIADRFGSGEVRLTAGMSGPELACLVLGEAGLDQEPFSPQAQERRTREYWTGWALSYYQWKTARSFSNIERKISISQICAMYEPYHEMDILQFSDALEEYCTRGFKEITLARLRKYAGLSQNMLAQRSDVPVRTIQQYEQRQKDIRRAGAEVLERLGRALCCRPEKLIED